MAFIEKNIYPILNALKYIKVKEFKNIFPNLEIILSTDL